MAKIDAQGNVTDATIDEDPDFPTEAQPVDEAKPASEVTEPKQDEKSKQRTTRK